MIAYLHDPHQAKKSFAQRFIRTPDFKVKRDKYVALGLVSIMG